MASDLATLAQCTLCPRLVARRIEVLEAHPDYHAGPVGSWGDPRANVIIVGLAPGLHGAARSGRAFVGDASGTFLFAALHRAGFASTDNPWTARLRGVRMTNAVKCLPPGNAPNVAELQACSGYLEAELDRYCPRSARRNRVIVTLGGVAHRAVCRALDVKGASFGHGVHRQIAAHLHLIASFHPSRLNVNTGRLTAAMLDDVFATTRALLT